MRINLTASKNFDGSNGSNLGQYNGVVCVLFLLLSMVLSGCGNKGDLYLPEKSESKQHSSSSSKPDESK